MSTVKRINKGDLVKIVTNTKFDTMLSKKNVTFLGTVLECRYKTDAYRIAPANSPFTTEPYWVSGSNLEVLRA